MTESANALSRSELTALGKDAFDNRKGALAMGTLGGGNHFIEIGYDENDKIWVTIHSGSRGVGHGIATNYMRLASGDGKVREGHCPLRTDSDDGRGYINDMNWALTYALRNRTEMLRKVIAVLFQFCGGSADWVSLINRNHNHAELKNGQWIHRKGATHAEDGMMGVIPGNMRDGSFVVRGKGNPDALWSSSHGAGRVLGRRKAKETLTMGTFTELMDGVTARVTEDTLDESPLAYKSIYEVMRLQDKLVDVVAHVRPIINIKG